MSAKSESDQPVQGGGYNAGGGLVAYPRPDEIVVPLRREEFETLCEGGAGEEKASRGLYIGAGVSALAGLVGVLATADWDTTWKPERRWWFLTPLLALCIMGTASIVGACIHHIHLRRTISSSAFSRLKARLLRLFDEPRTLEGAIEELPGTPAKRIGATSSVKWDNAANLFWLGSDLNWTTERVRRAAPKERIVHGLTQSYHHLSELGLADSVPGKLLCSLKSQAESAPEASLDQQWRNDFAGKLSDIIHDVSGMAQSQQPGFQPSPQRRIV